MFNLNLVFLNFCLFLLFGRRLLRVCLSFFFLNLNRLRRFVLSNKINKWNLILTFLRSIKFCNLNFDFWHWYNLNFLLTLFILVLLCLFQINWLSSWDTFKLQFDYWLWISSLWIVLIRCKLSSNFLKVVIILFVKC